MRAYVLGLCLALASCVGVPHTTDADTWTPSDAATSLITSGPLQARVTSSMSGDGSFLHTLYLTTTDHRRMVFIEANALPADLQAQTADGPLAQVMGLSGAGDRPTLYHFRRLPEDTPFLCRPDGPAEIGLYISNTNEVALVALRTEFQTESRADNTLEILPYSPDHVCARLRFRSG